MKFLSKKFKNDGYYHISIILALISIAVFLAMNVQLFPINFRLSVLSNTIFNPLEIRAGHKLWTFLTYQFYANGIFSMLFDCIFLLWCGGLIEQTIGSKEFLLYYILCVLTCSLVYFGIGFLPFYICKPFLFPLINNVAINIAMLFMFSYYARNIQILLFFVIPVRAPLVLLIMFIIELLSLLVAGVAAIPSFVCFIVGLIYASLYMLIRMKKDIKSLYKSIIGIN